MESLKQANEQFGKEKQIDYTYNQELKSKIEKLKPELDSFDLFGNQVLVALYKLEVKKTESGLILSTNVTQDIDTDTMRSKLKEVEYPYQYKGIVVKISDQVSEGFKERVKIGDVVGILKQSIPHMTFEVNPNNLIIGEDPRIVKINENHIERKFK